MELGMQISRSIENAMLPCFPYVSITTGVHSTEPSSDRQMVRQLMQRSNQKNVTDVHPLSTSDGQFPS